MNIRPALSVVSMASASACRAISARTRIALGGSTRMRAVLALAAVLALSGADVATVGASATQLRHALGINNTDIGLLIAASSLVAALASIPFGILADLVPRTPVLGGAIAFWGAAMIWSASVSGFSELLVARVFLGAVTAAAGPMVASLVGDYFPANERGRIYGYVLAGELVGTGFGFAVTGDVAALSWRAAFVVLALPAFFVAWLVFRLPEPARGGAAPLPIDYPRDGVQFQPDDGPTDAQLLAQKRGIVGDRSLALGSNFHHLNVIAATRYVLRVRTNLILIAASACGYYFLAGVQTFGIEFAEGRYRIDQGLANVLLLVVGGGAVAGVLAGGSVGDALVRRGILNGRILTSAGAATATAALFVPPLFTRDAFTALPYLMAAAFALSAQNPPLDAARLDIMPARLWGRAESIRTLLRSVAQAAAPLLFGAVSDYVFGGGSSGLRWTFVVMLVPLGGSATLVFLAARTYPGDVATAAVAAGR